MAEEEEKNEKSQETPPEESPTDEAQSEGPQESPPQEVQSPQEGDIGDHMSDDELSQLMGELLDDPASGVASASVPAFEDVSSKGDKKSSADFDMLMDVNLAVRVELGRTQMYIDDVLRLNEGSVVQLNKLAGDPIDVLVNNRLVARGEVLVLNDNFCVRLTEIIDPAERLK